MNKNLSGLKPEAIWRNFEKLTRNPSSLQKGGAYHSVYERVW
jgi:hypothetical protein